MDVKRLLGTVYREITEGKKSCRSLSDKQSQTRAVSDGGNSSIQRKKLASCTRRDADAVVENDREVEEWGKGKGTKKNKGPKEEMVTQVKP